MPIISDTKNDHHTPDMPNSLLIMYAAGTSIPSCLKIEIIMVYIPIPVPWKADPNAIDMLAGRKQKDIILSAGIPRAYICSVELNILRSRCGKNWKNKNPTAMMPNEIMQPFLTVSVILCLFLAP